MKKFFQSAFKTTSDGVKTTVRHIERVVKEGVQNSSQSDSLDSDGTEHHEIRLGKDLEQVLKILDLLKYRRIFSIEKIIIEDLPELDEEILRILVPDKIPRLRLEEYILKRYLPIPNGWELDSSKIFYDRAKKEKFYYHPIGDIKIADIVVSGVSVPALIHEFSIDECDCPKEMVIKETKPIVKLKSMVNVLRCFGCWFSEDSKKAYIAYENCISSHQSLRSFRRNNNQLTTKQKLETLLKIANALQYFHKCDVVIPCFTPRSILISKEDQSVKIVNIILESHAKYGPSRNIACSTPIIPYLSPEEFSGKKVLEKKMKNIFSFGIIAWEFWTAKDAYIEKRIRYKYNVFKMLCDIHGVEEGFSNDGDRPDVEDEAMQDCPEVMKDLICGCLEADPADRPPSFEFVVEELEYYLKDLDNKRSSDEESDDLDDLF